MRGYNSYEDWGVATTPVVMPDLLEAYSGVAIVGWYNQIRDKLARMIEEQEASRNMEYAQLLRGYLNLWESNPLTGSVNRETLEILKAGAAPLTKLKWSQQTYFNGVYKSLDQLIADQEQLPTGVPTDQNDPFAGGAGSSAPPMGDDFGPLEDDPNGNKPEEPGDQSEPDTKPPGAPGESDKEDDANNFPIR